MAKKVVTFGEIMLRLAPEGYYRFVQATSYGATYGGGEANVAVSLANYGMDASFVTKLPAHEIGQAGVNALRQYGVDTSDIVRGGDRVGIYFLEKGASQRPSKVVYDRAGSSIATATTADFDWDKIFDGADWFHFTGITPALGDNVAAICLEACKAAKAKGITVSCDLNYRNKLWSKEKAGQVMGELCKYVDVCISNEEDANDVFGIKSEGTEVTAGELNKEGYKEVAQKLTDRFGFKKVAITLRTSISANDNRWAAMLYEDVHEPQLLQVVCAYRLFMPFASITVSTRECARVRDNLVNIAATKISAGVSTGIGSHVDDIEDKGDDQFEISDERSVDEVYDALLKNNLQPVMSDYIYV